MEPKPGSTKHRISGTTEGSAKHPVPFTPSVPARSRRSAMLPWLLTGLMTIVAIALACMLLIPGRAQPKPSVQRSVSTTVPITDPSSSPARTSAIASAASVPPAAAETSIFTQASTAAPSPAPTEAPALAPSPAPALRIDNLETTVTDGYLHIRWNGTEDCIVRMADADDELPDAAVYEERQAAGTSVVFDHYVPEHTCHICFYTGSFNPETAVVIPYRTPKADPLGKYNLQLAAMSFHAVDPADPKIRTSIHGQPIPQLLTWMNAAGRACILELRLSHQRLNADRDVHYTLSVRAPNGAVLSLSKDGALRLQSADATSCTFDLTQVLLTLQEHASLTSGWYNVSLSINGRHAVKTSFELQ